MSNPSPAKKSWTVAELAAVCGGRVVGDACYALGLNRRARASWEKASALDKDAAGPRLKLERVR